MSDNPKHQRFGRVFHARPESEEDRNAALTQELVRDLHQQLMAAIAERDAALNQGVAVGGSFCGFVPCSLVIEQPDFSEGVAGGAWLEPERDLVLAYELDAAYAERNAAIAERDAARKEASYWKTWHDLMKRRGDNLRRVVLYAAGRLTGGDIDALVALSDTQKAADGLSGVSAGDGGDGTLRPSTAAYTAAVSIKKLGER